jgi:hypothetical protein
LPHLPSVDGDEIIKSVIGQRRARRRGDGVLGLHLGFAAPPRPYLITDLFCDISSFPGKFLNEGAMAESCGNKRYNSIVAV